MSVEKLKMFVARRNKSDFQSNLQFSIDLNACGLKVKDIGKAQRFTNFDTKETGWILDTKWGTLKEVSGTMSFHPNLLSKEQSSKFNKAIKSLNL